MRTFFIALSFCCLASYVSASVPDHLVAITDIDPKVFDMDFNDDHDEEKGESGFHFSRVINLKQNQDIAEADPVRNKFLQNLWHDQAWYQLKSSEGIHWHSVGVGKTPKTD